MVVLSTIETLYMTLVKNLSTTQKMEYLSSLSDNMLHVVIKDYFHYDDGMMDFNVDFGRTSPNRQPFDINEFPVRAIYDLILENPLLLDKVEKYHKSYIPIILEEEYNPNDLNFVIPPKDLLDFIESGSWYTSPASMMDVVVYMFENDYTNDEISEAIRDCVPIKRSGGTFDDDIRIFIKYVDDVAGFENMLRSYMSLFKLHKILGDLKKRMIQHDGKSIEELCHEKYNINLWYIILDEEFISEGFDDVLRQYDIATPIHPPLEKAMIKLKLVNGLM